MQHQTELFVGTRGWDYDAWSGLFFPEDLPAEWRLTYYANEYSVVLIPHQHWMSALPSEAGDWADDVPERFRFFIHAPGGCCEPDGMGRRLLACVEALGDRCGGVVTDDRGLQAYIENHDPKVRVYQFHEVMEVGANLYLADQARHREGCLRVLLCESDHLPELPGRRALIERLVADCGPKGDAVLFLTGEPPALDKADETLTLAQLLGVA